MTPPVAAGPNKPRLTLPSLTGIRFFAAFYVVMFHALPWVAAHFALPAPIHTFLSNGYLAVAFFFLLSGFILAYSYEGHLGSHRERAKFWEARFARIYPVYFLSLILALPFQTRLTLGVKLSVLAMVQAWMPWHPAWTGAWNYPAWSLSVEGFFYLCFPILQLFLARLSAKALRLSLLVAAVVCIFSHTPTQGLGIWSPTTMYSQFLPLPVLRLPEFILGMALGNLFLRRTAPVPHNALVTVAGAVVAIALLSLPIGPWISLVVIPFGIVIYALADATNRIGGFFSSRLMLLLGGASYSVYLLQAPFRDWVRVLSGAISPGVQRFATSATPLLLVLFSIFIFKFWEEPSRRAIRRWFGARPVTG